MDANETGAVLRIERSPGGAKGPSALGRRPIYPEVVPA